MGTFLRPILRRVINRRPWHEALLLEEHFLKSVLIKGRQMRRLGESAQVIKFLGAILREFGFLPAEAGD